MALLVKFVSGGKTFERFVQLGELLEERLGQRVELVTTESLSPFIGPRILADEQDVLRAVTTSATSLLCRPFVARA